jgi:hypothetical protein
MTVRLCTYNVEWFDDAFSPNNNLRPEAKWQQKAAAIAEVIRKVDPDLVTILEGPGTTASSGKSTVACLEGFAAQFNLRQSKTMMGFPSQGRQEIALMFDPLKVTAEHKPGGSTTSRTNPPFDDEFRYDSDEDGVYEIYKHYRPPMEMRVNVLADNTEFWLIAVHAKSKGIFSNNDMLHYEREEERNRRKLFAETGHVRLRVDEWLKKGRRVVVTGDINDGPGMDAAEFRFGRSAVEIVMGDLFEPDGILRSWAGRPKWGQYGFEPSSARFTDRFTEDPINVLIDHILASSAIAVAGKSAHIIWNPYQNDLAKAFKSDLLKAADHFPVTLDLS